MLGRCCNICCAGGRRVRSLSVAGCGCPSRRDYDTELEKPRTCDRQAQSGTHTHAQARAYRHGDTDTTGEGGRYPQPAGPVYDGDVSATLPTPLRYVTDRGGSRGCKGNGGGGRVGRYRRGSRAISERGAQSESKAISERVQGCVGDFGGVGGEKSVTMGHEAIAQGRIRKKGWRTKSEGKPKP